MKRSFKISAYLLCLLFVLVFSVPRTLQFVKIIILIILLVIAIFKTQKIKVDFVQRISLYSTLFIIPLFIAFFNGNEINFIISSLNINLIYPLIFLLIIQVFNKDELVYIIQKSSRISLFFILVINLSTLLFAFNLFPININTLFYPNEMNIGIHDGYIHIINSSLSYLIFIVPIVFFDIKSYNFKNPKLYIFILLLIFCIITGRRILLLPFILIFLFNFKHLYRTVFVILLPVALFFVYNISIENQILDLEIVVDRFEDALYSRGDSEAREEQSVMFEKYISQRPLFGYGLGSYMPDYIRNANFKTAYERTYHYIIYSLGFIIAILIFLFYLFCLRKVYKTADNCHIIKLGFLTGILSLLIASYTNPYWLSSFDYCLPLALLVRFSQNDKYEENNRDIGYIQS